ncbi:hypothetical protein MYTO111405_03930 [Mycoplasma todarodis]
MALPRSSVFENEVTNNGIISVTVDLTLALGPPFLKSTPLDACAFIILWDSSSNVGINLKAIAIIMAIMCTGNFISFNGNIKSSRPLVKSIGLVVEVKIVVMIIMK